MSWQSNFKESRGIFLSLWHSSLILNQSCQLMRQNSVKLMLSLKYVFPSRNHQIASKWLKYHPWFSRPIFGCVLMLFGTASSRLWKKVKLQRKLRQKKNASPLKNGRNCQVGFHGTCRGNKTIWPKIVYWSKIKMWSSLRAVFAGG